MEPQINDQPVPSHESSRRGKAMTHRVAEPVRHPLGHHCLDAVQLLGGEKLPGC
jgi:hypothetical protein